MKNSVAVDMESFEEFFSENGGEAISTITGMIATQQNIAPGLAKLVLEHCFENKISKEEIFKILSRSLRPSQRIKRRFNVRRSQGDRGRALYQEKIYAK